MFWVIERGFISEGVFIILNDLYKGEEMICSILLITDI